MNVPEKILYIGGFELPDKNAAAQRVIGVAKALKDIGYDICFLNALRNAEESKALWKNYFGFDCLEYRREGEFDFLVTAHTTIGKIKEINPSIIIAYNYPAFSLNKIRKYCKKNQIRCYADATEWYQAFGVNPVYKIIKNIDTGYRMKVVQKKIDGVIAISKYLYDYYKESVNTVIIPPIVDLNEEKWNAEAAHNKEVLNFVYAGSPSVQKEKLDLIISAIERMPFDYRVVLNIVGVSKNQFRQIYGWKDSISERVHFWGRTEHKKVIEIVKSSNWSIILRDNNQVVRAGFPTKLVESISCGTPVIVNDFSNIKDYLNTDNSIMIDNYSEIDNALVCATTTLLNVDRSIFDYHKYEGELLNLLKKR